MTDFAAETAALLNRHGETLLDTAARSIEYGLEHGRRMPVNGGDFDPELRNNGACFVTLKKEGRLRGCIGSAQARRPLYEDVAANSFACAFSDHRFPKLVSDELDRLELSISVLSSSAAITFRDETELLDQLRPGTDGLIIEDNNRRALFLPSVWESLADPADFLGHLKLKAGMERDYFSNNFKAWRFIAIEIKAEPQSIWKLNRTED